MVYIQWFVIVFCWVVIIACLVSGYLFARDVAEYYYDEHEDTDNSKG